MANFPTEDDDTITGTALGDIISALGGNDTVNGADGDDTLNGDDGNDTLNGESGNDTLVGGDGNDVLTGDDGDDILIGGASGDTVYGNGGNDIFQYNAVTDSNSTERDGIQDFYLGDKIDVSRIDANVIADGKQGFSFIGSAAFGNHAGELRYENISLGGPIWLVQGDTDGNGVSDFELVLVVADGDAITADDFMLGNNDAVANDDTNSTTEIAAVTGNVKTNDSDAEGDAFTITSVNGDSAKVGQQITLGSGALLTLNADGSYSYDPNGAFTYLTDGTSGAVDTKATDSFQYTVTGGDTASVTITINGVAGAGDRLEGDSGDNIINGTASGDQFVLDQGGNDTVKGFGGNDAFYLGAALTAADRIDGGAGTDVIQLRGDYGAGLTLGADTITGIERITLLSGTTDGLGNLYDYSLTTNDKNVAAGQTLSILGGGLQAGEDLTFNGMAEQDGMFYLQGGAGNDTLVGGQQKDTLVGGSGADSLYGLGGDDVLTGGGGADTLRGGFGKDVFLYQATSDSDASATDVIQDFQKTLDKIDLTQIDANSLVDGNQAFAYIGSDSFGDQAGQLRAYEFEGSWFVEGDVDGNGTADFVLQVNVVGLQPLTATDFYL
jgi:Ca2+-binding RTX toxin-like protein